MPKSPGERAALALLTPVVVATLAGEIQHLLRDPSDRGTNQDAIIVGWRCGEVAAVTAAVLHKLGLKVLTTGGAAIFTHRPNAASRQPDTNLVIKHYWLEAAHLGIVDFSPTLIVPRSEWTPIQFDYVFANEVVAPESWRFRSASISGDREQCIMSHLRWFYDRNERRAAIYLTQRSQSLTADACRQFLYSSQGNLLALPGLRPEFDQEVETVNRKLVFHLVELVHGRRSSLRNHERRDAWREILQIPIASCAELTA